MSLHVATNRGCLINASATQIGVTATMQIFIDHGVATLKMIRESTVAHLFQGYFSLP